MPRDEVDVRHTAGQYVTPVYLTWYLDDVEIGSPDSEDVRPFVPRVGDGVIWDNGRRYVVAGVWQSFEKNGCMNLGHHVFLRPASESEDEPNRAYPDYYT